MKTIKNIALLMLLVLASCAKEKTDISGLLASVPSSAGAVAGLNLQSMLTKAGFKLDGNEIKSGDIDVSKICTLSPDGLGALKAFTDNESGIDPTCAILFFDANRTYLTFGLIDTGKFRDYIQKWKGESFVDANGGVSVCSNVAMKGAQAWISLFNYDISSDAVAGYSSLSASQSFLSHYFGEKIKEMTHDISAWGKLTNLSRTLWDFRQTSMFNVVSSALYDNAEDVIFEADFEKGKFEGKLSVINEKGKPAKYLLPAEKINVETASSIGTGADVFVALTITPKLVEKIDKLGGSLAGAVFKNTLEGMKSIDGTVAVAFSNPDELFDNMSGVVTTDGNPSMLLKSTISLLSPMREDGNLIRFSKGATDGKLKIKDCAELLKGATLGIVTDIPQDPVSQLANIPLVGPALINFEYYCLKLVPSDGSADIVMVIGSDNKGENILKTILKTNCGS